MEKTESLVLKAQRGSKEAFVALIEREKLSMSRVMVVMPYILLLKIEGGSGIIKM